MGEFGWLGGGGWGVGWGGVCIYKYKYIIIYMYIYIYIYKILLYNIGQGQWVSLVRLWGGRGGDISLYYYTIT